MITQLSPRERLGYVLLVAALLGVAGFVGTQHLKGTPDIVVRPPDSRFGASAAAGSSESPAQTADPSPPVVHVAGAVAKPGLYTLKPGSRVADAIGAAGGEAKDADLEQINLAARLQDGSQLFVPKRGEPPASSGPEQEGPYAGGPSIDSPYKSARAAPKSGGGSSSKTPAEGSINLNTASASELDRLPGVGPVIAQEILRYRKVHGGFTSVDELLAVKGIGPKKLAAMRKFVKL